MRHLIQIVESTLLEGRDGYLYHGTDLVNAALIIRDNRIDGYTEREHLPDAVSTSRDPRAAFEFGTYWDRQYPTLFVLDQRKLAHRFKLVPHSDKNSDGENWGDNPRGAEAEERVIGSISPLDPYLVSICVDPEYLRRARWRDVRWWVDNGDFNSRQEAVAAIDALMRHPKLNAIPFPPGVEKINQRHRKDMKFRRSPTKEPVVVETASASYFDPSAVWLHGGPAKLEGGHFRRQARQGRDMGGLYFVKEGAEGWKHALGYAVARAADGGVYRCRLKLQPDEVLDFTNAAHRNRLKDALPPASFEALAKSAGDGHLPWIKNPEFQRVFEQIATALGFGGAVFMERAQGNTLSVCVFDPTKVEIIDFTPKSEALAQHGGAPTQ